MKEELRHLQAKYIAGVDDMEEADVRRYLALLDADYGLEFRERRMQVLRQRIRAIDAQARAEQRRKDEQAYYIDCSRKFKAITDGWEAQGAECYPVADGNADVWAIDGREIFRMYGALSGLGKRIDEYLADTQRVDAELFVELIRKGAKK